MICIAFLKDIFLLSFELVTSINLFMDSLFFKESIQHCATSLLGIDPLI